MVYTKSIKGRPSLGSSKIIVKEYDIAEVDTDNLTDLLGTLQAEILDSYQESFDSLNENEHIFEIVSIDLKLTTEFEVEETKKKIIINFKSEQNKINFKTELKTTFLKKAKSDTRKP